jgi:hypothetical protein
MSRARFVSAAALVLAVGLAGCGSDDDDTIRLWIEPALVDCEGGAGPQLCLEVARSEDGKLELFYSEIEGFDFQEGTSYVIDVSVEEVADPPADGSSLRYTLVEVIEPSG